MDNIQNEMAALFGAQAQAEPTEPVTPEADPAPSTEPVTPVTEPAPTVPADSDAEDTTTTPTSDGEQKPAGTEPAPEKTFEPEAKFNKQNQAFAEMRVRTKEYEQILIDLAKLTGADIKSAEEAKAILQKSTQEYQAKTKNVDPVVLKELDESKRALEEMRAQQLKSETIAGFAKIKSLHGLSDAELGEFADVLLEQKKNPFEQKLDLVNEYRLINFEKLMQKAKDDAAKAAVERYKKGLESGSNPGTQQGKNPTGNSGKEIKTSADLENLFKTMGR